MKPNWRKRRGTRAKARAAGRRSGLEVKVEAALKAKGLKPQYEVTKLKYQRKPQTYVVDFTVGDVLIEVKGRMTAPDRSKMLAVKEAHPERDIRFVIQKDNFLYKGSKTRYSEWLTKHGFKWACFPDLPI